jgi:hypothetical protein
VRPPARRFIAAAHAVSPSSSSSPFRTNAPTLTSFAAPAGGVSALRAAGRALI